MWAQSWNSLQDLLMPFPSKPILDVTEEMVKQVGLHNPLSFHYHLVCLVLQNW